MGESPTRIRVSHPTGDQGLPAQRGARGPFLGRSSGGVCPQTRDSGDSSHPQVCPGVSLFPDRGRGGCCLSPDKSKGSFCPQDGSCGGFSRGSTLALSVLHCSDKFTRFCQWKNVELNIHVSRDPCASGQPGHLWALPGRGTWVQ